MPSVTRGELGSYLQSLPQGMDSYPECRVRAATLVAALDLLQLSDPEELATLPPAVRALVRRPPPRTRHIPEVHNLAFYSWLRDARFESDEGYLTFTDAAFRRFYATPLYRVAFMMSHPEQVAGATPRLWGWIREGSRLEIVTRSAGQLTLRLSYPPYLFTDLHVEGIARGLAIAYSASLGIDGSVAASKRAYGPTETLLDVRWDPHL